MGVSYEWHRPNAGESAIFIDADGLRDLTEDTGDITDTTVGVSFDDGGGGAIVYGEPARLLSYYATIVDRLAAHVAATPPTTVVDPRSLDAIDQGDLYRLREQIVTTLDERSKDGFADAVRTVLAANPQETVDLLGAVVDFPANQWEDGYFYDALATVMDGVEDPDPETSSVFYDTPVEAMLRELSSVRRHDRGMTEDSYLRVHLATGVIEHL